MTPAAALRSGITQYAVFRGRASRSEYWWFSLACAILGGGAFAWDRIAGTTVIGLVVIMPLVIPSLAVTVRRLHDSGHSGWWTLISIAPFGQLVLIALACLRSDRTDNAYGPPSASVRTSKASRPVQRPVSRRVNSMNRRLPTKPGPRVTRYADSTEV
jgi:uncharacterized membrane protein YhaH (DUF805 family)